MRLSERQLRAFEADGFLVIPDVLDVVTVLDPLAHEYEAVLDRVANQLFEQGLVASTYADLPFGPRFIRLGFESNDTLAQHFDCSLPQSGVAADTPYWFGPQVLASITHPDLLDVVESVLGNELYASPVQHLRIKAPEASAARDEAGAVKLGATTWHQDAGVLLPIADHTDVLTAWFSLADAREEHGCLLVVPGSHRRELLTHCPTPQGLAIPLDEVGAADAVPLPTRRGDVILLHKLLVHSSLPNVSDEVRWSLDLRYQPIGQPTGREAFPGFVARSASRPGTELRDAAQWEAMWREARERLAARPPTAPFHRWNESASGC